MEKTNLKVSTKKYRNNRDKFVLTDDDRKNIKSKIENTVLSEQDKLIINKTTSEKNISDYCNRKTKQFIKREEIITLIYIMRYKLNIKTLYMASYLNIEINSFAKKLASLGWRYSPNEAQQMAGKESRNYSQIRIKAKQTMLSSLSKSPIEERIRQYINLKLAELIPNYEIIVGCNNLSILSNTNKEVDIPIIILNKEKIYKFAIEVNGVYWHGITNAKKEMLINKGYNFYEVWICTTTEQRKIKNLAGITEDVDAIINKIIDVTKF